MTASTDAAGRRYVPAPLQIPIEQADAEDAIAALIARAYQCADDLIEYPDGRVDLELNAGNATEAAGLYRTALAIEDARLAAEARRGNGRPRSRR